VQNLSRSSFARENFPSYNWWQANQPGRQSSRLEGVSFSLRVLSVFHNFASPTSSQANPVWPATKSSKDKFTLQNLSAGGRLSFERAYQVRRCKTLAEAVLQGRIFPAKVGGRPTSLAVSLADWKEFHYLCMFFLSSTILLVQLPLRLTLSGLPPRLAGIIHLAKPLCRWQAFILESLPGSEVQNLSRSSFARENFPSYGWW
jgi:hypothetical protein